LPPKRKAEPAAPAKSSREERRDPVARRRSPSPHTRAGRNGRDERTRSSKRSPSPRYKASRQRASSRGRDDKSSTRRDSPNPASQKKLCGDEKDRPSNDKTLPKKTSQSPHRSQGEQSKMTLEKKLEKEEAKKTTEPGPAKHQVEKETAPNTNGSKTREPVGDKKAPLEDGEIREEKKERREKMKDPTTMETSKETKESSKAADVVLPEFTKIQVTKLSRNVTQAHIREIFSTWGQVKLVDMPTDHNHPEFHRGYAYVEYITAKAASDAVNYMNGGQIDGQEVNIIEVLSRVSPTRDRRRSTERQLSSKRRSIDRPISPRRRHNQGRRLGHDDASVSRSRDYTADRRGGGAGYHQRGGRSRSPHSPVRPSRNSPFASRSGGGGENRGDVGVNRSPPHAPAQIQPANSGGNAVSSNGAGSKAGADTAAGSSRYRRPNTCSIDGHLDRRAFIRTLFSRYCIPTLAVNSVELSYLPDCRNRQESRESRVGEISCTTSARITYVSAVAARTLNPEKAGREQFILLPFPRPLTLHEWMLSLSAFFLYSFIWSVLTCALSSHPSKLTLRPPPKRDRRSRSPLESTRLKVIGGGESRPSEPMKDTTSRPPQRAPSRGGVGARPTTSRRRRTSTSTSSGSSSATSSSASSSSSGSTSRSSSTTSRSSRSRSSTKRRGGRRGGGGAGWRGGRRGDSRGGGRGRGTPPRSRSRSGPLRSRR
uniref:RRM domain-containing protein n=1 Tax=Hymenolepis diminuta TaxID=6216 RepID=A0A158QC55_HYMDI